MLDHIILLKILVMPEVGLTEYETGNYLELTSISYYPEELWGI